MLDPWIIEEIIKREREDRQDELPLEIPLDRPDLPAEKDNSSSVHEDDEIERGVVIVDFRV
jgi:hypothetical protein